MNTHTPNHPRATRWLVAVLAAGALGAGCASGDRPRVVASPPGPTTSASTTTPSIPATTPSTTTIAVPGSAPAPAVTTEADRSGPDFSGSDLSGLDAELSELNTQLSEADHDLATPEGDF